MNHPSNQPAAAAAFGWRGSSKAGGGRARWPAVDTAASPAAQDTPARGVQQQQHTTVPPPFSVPGLVLQPGAEVCGLPAAAAAAAGAIDQHLQLCYTLESQLHQGPRSAVWRAVASSSQQQLPGLPEDHNKEQQQQQQQQQQLQQQQQQQEAVVLKVLALGSAERRAAALRELEALSTVAAAGQAQPAAPAASEQHAAAPSASSSSSSSSAATGGQAGHLPELLGALWVPGEQKKSKQPRPPPPKPASEASQQQQQALADCSAALVLVLSPLHQSLAWVLHWVRSRSSSRGGGLPPPAVRSLAHQLLSGLAVLHDEHALVHRDVKPSNTCLQQPFVVRTGKKHLMRGMTLQELTSAQWTLTDLGSAGQLLPRPAAPAAAADGGAQQGASAPAQGPGQAAAAGPVPWLQRLWAGLQPHSSSSSMGSAPSTPSTQRWHVAPGDTPPYETAPYSPPEAVLHLPATPAYDVWSAACLIYEAATGRLLFPVEAAAAARQRILRQGAAARRRLRPSGGGGSSRDEDGGDPGTQLDEVHLAMMRGLNGRPPAQLLARASPSVVDALYADARQGLSWLSDEEDEGLPDPATAHRLGPSGWRGQFCGGPLLHRLIAGRAMSLDEATALAGLLAPMLAWDPDERPTAASLLQHPYFKPLRRA